MNKSIEQKIRDKFGVSLCEFQKKLSDEWAEQERSRDWKGISDIENLKLIIEVRLVMETNEMTIEEFADIHLIHPVLLRGFLNRQHGLNERLIRLLSMACNKYIRAAIDG